MSKWFLPAANRPTLRFFFRSTFLCRGRKMRTVGTRQGRLSAPIFFRKKFCIFLPFLGLQSWPFWAVWRRLASKWPTLRFILKSTIWLFIFLSFWINTPQSRLCDPIYFSRKCCIFVPFLGLQSWQFWAVSHQLLNDNSLLFQLIFRISIQSCCESILDRLQLNKSNENLDFWK